MSTQEIYNYRKADAFRASIWQGSDYPVWEAFIGRMKTQIATVGRL